MHARHIAGTLWSVLLASCLLGCGQKNIKGQVFIVTRSAENIKLGLVDVLVLDEQSVAAFLDKKKPAIEREVSLRADNFRKAEHELQEAQHELQEFQKNDAAFQFAFVSLKFEFTCLEKEIRELQNGPTESRLAIMREMQKVRAQKTDSLDASSERLINALDLGKQLAAIDQKERENAQELERKKTRYAEVEKQIIAIAGPSDKMQAALSNRVAICSVSFDRSKAAMESFPSLQYYFSDPLPAPLQKTVTDADGRFEMKLPRRKRLAVFAQATRKVAADTERYVWFFWLPSDNDNTQLMLSNKNLVFTDYPGNVLPVKPKAVD